MPDAPTDLTSLVPFAAKCGIRITLADTVGAACAFLNLPPTALVTRTQAVLT